MLGTNEKVTLGILVFLCVVLTVLLNIVLSKKNKKQIEKIFAVIFVLMITSLISDVLQIFCVNRFNSTPIYFDYVAYIGVCYLPVAFLFFSLIFAKTQIKLKKSYLLLLVIPTISLLMLWTNDWHHLFYEVYSTDFTVNVYGKYFPVHSYYTYLLFGISLVILMRYSIKNSGFFSKQAILILVGALIPVITNVIGKLE